MPDNELREVYLHPTQEAGRKFVQRNISGEFLMLNLLKFNKYADYSKTPELTPATPISGETAYEIYIAQTLPYLLDSGGQILFYGKSGNFLIGPHNEQWDCVMLIKQRSISDFLAFNSCPDYLKIMGHRTAALKDSRLLPIETTYSH